MTVKSIESSSEFVNVIPAKFSNSDVMLGGSFNAKQIAITTRLFKFCILPL